MHQHFDKYGCLAWDKVAALRIASKVKSQGRVTVNLANLISEPIAQSSSSKSLEDELRKHQDNFEGYSHVYPCGLRQMFFYSMSF